ncbi:TPA: ComF family protein [Candidatus Gracilibacteria bacterium]|nr:ComF family protein [Candidatus Gracilibacteria bacterium]
MRNYKKLFYLNKIIKNIKNIFLNIFFPIECISCQKPDRLICYNCLAKVHTRLNNSKLFSGLEMYAAYGFSIPIVRKLITRAKYYHSPILFEELTLHAITTLAPIFLLHKQKKIILIPVPLHFIRMQKRGFNQSEIIANILADTFENTQVLNLVLRIKNTSQQAKLNKEERIKNIQNSFEMNKNIRNNTIKTISDNINNYKFMIIDDVISTGSTVMEIEKLLITTLSVNKKDIMAVSLCRG